MRDELAKSPEKILGSAFPEFFPKPEVELVSTSAAPATALLAEEGLTDPQPQANISCPSSATTGAGSDAYFQGLALIKTLVKLVPGWLQSNRVVFDTLVLVWKSPARISRLQNEQELNLVQVCTGQYHLFDILFKMICLSADGTLKSNIVKLRNSYEQNIID